MERVATERAVLANITTAVLLFNSDLQVIFLNSAAEMILELSARKAIGRKAMDLFLYAPDLEQRLQHSLRSGEPTTQREVRLDLGPERGITIDLSINPLSEEQDPRLIVEMQQVDRHLRISREELLLAQHEASRALLRGMAHEIKNPLGGLRGAAQLLERELPDESQREFTQVIISEADRLQNLMDRMLGPNQLPQRESVNIHEILERVRSLLLAEFTQGITIKRDYDPSIPDFEADPEQLIQTLLNIVRNGAQALVNGGTITLRSRVQRQFTIGHQRYRLVMRVEVEDNGPGIPAELIDKIFFPMVTGRSDGTGLGLSIAQSLVNQMGGLIEVCSAPGQTLFTLWLPLERTHE